MTQVSALGSSYRPLVTDVLRVAQPVGWETSELGEAWRENKQINDVFQKEVAH